MFFKRGRVVPAHYTVQDSKTNWCGNYAHVHLYEGRLLLLLCGRVCMFFLLCFQTSTHWLSFQNICVCIYCMILLCCHCTTRSKHIIANARERKKGKKIVTPKRVCL